ncbi:MAG: HYR domain-containing protein [Flavobacteriaceae bacterium]|nr:HYR domain-containing protein [Flavobacteriaceae bacterium]
MCDLGLDSTLPTVVTQDITIQLDATGNATITPQQIDNGSTDNCAIANGGLSLDITSFNITNIGTNTVTLTVKDTNGNLASSTATVTITDVTPPTVVTQKITVNLDASGNATITPQQIDNGSSDLSGPVTLSLDQTNFTCADVNTSIALGEALNFDGVNDQINLGSPAALNFGSNDFSIEASFRTTSTTWNYIVSKGGDVLANERGYGLAISNGSVYGFLTSSQGRFTFPAVGSGFNDGQWHQYTGVFKRNGNFEAYIDGVLIGTTNISAYNGSSSGTSPTYIGLQQSNNRYWSGDIDEVRFWNYALQPSEIQSRLNTGLTGTETGLVGYYPLNDGVAGANNFGAITAADASVNSNNGILSNFALSGTNSNWIIGSGGSNAGNTVTLTVTDASGNTATGTAVVTVVDNTAPTVITQPITVKLDANGNATITPQQIDNGSSDNCGPVTLSLDAGQGNFTCANVGTTNTVTLVATDSHGNVATGTATVTVQDNMAPGGGGSSSPSGLGTVPQLALNNVPEASGFGLLYQLDIPNAAAWTAGVPYTVDNSSLTGLNFSRVAYLLELDNKWVWVSMDAFTTNLAQLGLPQQNQAGNSFIQQRIVNNMTVVASSNSGLASRQNVATGNLEIWNYNYAADNIAGVPNANNTYDWGDRSAGSSTYSSFQIHDHGAQLVMLAYNGWGLGGTSDIGINNNTGNLHKDYTFMQNAGNYNVKKLYIFVGNSSTASGVLTQDITVQLDATGSATITPQMIDNGTTDNCGIASYTLDKTTFTCANLGTNTVTLTVTDNSGNTSTATATVTVEDNIAPTVQAKPITVQLDAFGNASIAAGDIDNGSYDNCGAVTLSLDAGQGNFTCANIGPNTVNLVVTDASNNTAFAPTVVTVVDTMAPTALAKDFVLNLNDQGVGSITVSQIDNGSTDNCGIQSMTVTPTTFTCADVGVQQVTLTVTDNSGNVATASANVTVQDITGPTVATQNLTVSLDANGTASVTAQQFDAGSTDACGIASYALTIPRGVTIDPANLTCADVGTHNLTLVVTDINNNETQATVTVTVQDTTVPVIATPLDINMVATSAQGAVVNYTAPVGTDNCTPTTTLTAGLASGATFPIGTTVVTYTVTDPSGNTASSSFNVVVVGVAPVIVSPGDITQNTDAGQCGALVSYAATETVGIPASTITYTIAPGSNFVLGTTAVTATATNAIGSSSTTFNVIVQDNTAPTVLAQPITVQLDATGNATINTTMIDNGSYDNCSVTLSLDLTGFGCENVGVNTVTLTGTDPSGNVSTATAQVTVEDNIFPTVITQAFTTTIMGGVATVTPTDVDGGSYDNCGIQSMSVSPSTFVCGDQGNHTVTLTVTDNSGNVSTATTIVTVVGEVPTIGIDSFTAVPTQSTNTVYLGYGPQSITLNTNTTGGTGFTYSWTSSTGWLVSSVANPTISPLVSTTYTVTVTNANGCEATTSLDVCVIDARYINKEGEWDDGKVLVCRGSDNDDDKDKDKDHSSKGDDDDHGSKTKAVKAKKVAEYLEHGGTLGGCNATCTTTYVEVIVDNDDDDHADNDDKDHSDDNGDDKDDDKKGKDKDHSSRAQIKTLIYPNPVINTAVIGMNKKGSGLIQVYNYQGHLIFSKKVKDIAKGANINMSNKKTGTYFVRIRYKGKVYTSTIFKDK